MKSKQKKQIVKIFLKCNFNETTEATRWMTSVPDTVSSYAETVRMPSET